MLLVVARIIGLGFMGYGVGIVVQHFSWPLWVIPLVAGLLGVLVALTIERR